MGNFSTTLAELIQRIAYSFNDCELGIPASGTTSTIVCSTLNQSDDYWNKCHLHFYSGTLKGTDVQVTDFVNSTKTITFSPTVSAITTSDLFQIHKKFSWTQYKKAVDRAIDSLKFMYVLDKVDETTTLTEDIYEYAIPSGFYYINQIIREDDTDADTFYASGVIDNRKWGILHSSSPKIKFSDNTYGIGAADTGQKLRIVGHAIQGSLTSDSDICYLPPEAVILFARSILSYDSGSFKEGDTYRALAMNEMRLYRSHPVAGAKSVYEI